VVPPEHPYPLAEEGYASGRRAARIVELILEAGRSIDVEAIRGIHGDVYSIPASELVPHLMRIEAEDALEAWMAYRESRRTGATSEEQADVRERMQRILPAALSHLGAWEYEMKAESAAAAVYAFVFEAVTEHVFRDEVPSFAWPLISHGTAESAITELLNEPDNLLWDDRVTSERERASDILARSLAAGVYRLSQEQGDDPASWEWGNSHSLTLENQSLGQSGIGIVERLLNRGPFPIDGGPTTVSPAGWNASEPFDVTFGVSQRAIYDLADPSNSRFIHPTGQSGHAFHRHYDDMVEPYLNLQYHRSNWTYEEAREAAGGRRLVLEPEG
jgi:penicillin amidase